MKFRIHPTPIVAEEVLITSEERGLRTSSLEKVQLDHSGLIGDRHYGKLRHSGARETNLFPKGTQIPNLRQWSAVSVEELNRIAQNMEINKLEAGWIGANFLFSGYDDFSKLPPFTRIRFNNPERTTLVVYEENDPCRFPQPHIEAGLGQKVDAAFAQKARNLRGNVGWVETGGTVHSGTTAELWIPEYSFE